MFTTEATVEQVRILWTKTKCRLKCKKVFSALGGRRGREGRTEGERSVWPGTWRLCLRTIGPGRESESGEDSACTWSLPPASTLISDVGKFRERVGVRQEGHAHSLCGRGCGHSLFVRSPQQFAGLFWKMLVDVSSAYVKACSQTLKDTDVDDR